jgi:hypothetical protein
MLAEFFDGRVVMPICMHLPFRTCLACVVSVVQRALGFFQAACLLNTRGVFFLAIIFCLAMFICLTGSYFLFTVTERLSAHGVAEGVILCGE